MIIDRDGKCPLMVSVPWWKVSPDGKCSLMVSVRDGKCPGWYVSGYRFLGTYTLFEPKKHENQHNSTAFLSFPIQFLTIYDDISENWDKLKSF